MPFCPTCNAPMPDAHGIVIDEEALTISRNGVSLKCTRSEISILAFLAKKFGRAVDKWTMIDNLYQLKPEADHPEHQEKLMQVFVCRLRRKLAGLGLKISTVWGTGYMLENVG